MFHHWLVGYKGAKKWSRRIRSSNVALLLSTLGWSKGNIWPGRLDKLFRVWPFWRFTYLKSIYGHHGKHIRAAIKRDKSEKICKFSPFILESKLRTLRKLQNWNEKRPFLLQAFFSVAFISKTENLRFPLKQGLIFQLWRERREFFRDLQMILVRHGFDYVFLFLCCSETDKDSWSE